MSASVLTLDGVRRSLNFAGWPAHGSNLERLIAVHLDTVAALQDMEPRMANLVVLISQGYNDGECATRLGVCRNTMPVLRRRLRREFYTDLAVPAVIPTMVMEADEPELHGKDDSR